MANNAPEAGKMDRCECLGNSNLLCDLCSHAHMAGACCKDLSSTPAVVSRDQWDDMDEELAMANARIVDLEGREKQLEDALREARKFASENAAFGLVERIDRALSPSASKEEKPAND